jgi:hypothetical protein
MTVGSTPVQVPQHDSLAKVAVGWSGGALDVTGSTTVDDVVVVGALRVLVDGVGDGGTTVVDVVTGARIVGAELLDDPPQPATARVTIAHIPATTADW